MSPLPDLIFAALSARLTRDAADIARIAATRYSFEEWLNWETYLACADAGLDALARPRYSALGVTGRDFADLRIQRPPESVVVETAILHGDTGHKWIAKIDNDTAKLRRLRPDHTGLQIILATSVKHRVTEEESWVRFLGRTHIWNQPTPYRNDFPLNVHGQCALRAWIIAPTPIDATKPPSHHVPAIP